MLHSSSSPAADVGAPRPSLCACHKTELLLGGNLLLQARTWSVADLRAYIGNATGSREAFDGLWAAMQRCVGMAAPLGTGLPCSVRQEWQPSWALGCRAALCSLAILSINMATPPAMIIDQKH